jgi:hypothetical protein
MADAKGLKMRRCSKHKTMYAAQVFATEKNKRKKIGRRIRSNPADKQAIKRYEETYGSADGHLGNLSAKGRKLKKRMV